MTDLELLLLAVSLIASGGVLALATFRSPRACSLLAALGAVAGCAVGLVPAFHWLAGAPEPGLRLAWAVPSGEIVLGADPLTGLFLVPLLGLSLVAAIYGRAYLLPEGRHRSLGPAWFFFNVTVASMVLILVARSTVLFLVAWELMSVASFLLVSFDHQEREVRRAAWVYLIAAHVGVAALLVLFQLLGAQAGGFDFQAFQAMAAGPGAGPGPWTAGLFFLLAAIGFGTKAGFVPLHVWLPEAHAAAPSHVSALMSGVLIKMGLYGFLRVLTFLPQAAWWGPVLICLGLAGGFLGAALSLYQRDLKRVLAYSSIENMGLILVGLGTGYWGLSRGSAMVASLGFAGALLHVWNHAVAKGLMFLAAGSVLHATGTRDLEKLGGLLKRLPRTGPLLILGAVAISGLPPLNCFAGEWLLYLGLAHGGEAQRGFFGVASLIGVGAVALIGALAVLSFVRLTGIVLLGTARTPAAAAAHESPPSMTGPLLVLAVLALAIGVFPGQVLAVLAAPAGQLGGALVADAFGALAEQLSVLGWTSAGILGAVAVVVAVFAVRLRGRKPAVEDTWGCGYAAPTARMQYGGWSFSELIAERIFPPLLRPRSKATPPAAIFPSASRFETSGDDPLTRGFYEPFLVRWSTRFAKIRWMQQGVLHVYLLYIVLVLVLGIAWASARLWLAP